MQKILANSSLTGKELRKRQDIPPLLKTATHRFNKQSIGTFNAWLQLLSGSEKQTVRAYLGISK